MSNHENGKQTGAFRFKSQWHVSDGDLYGSAMTGTPFAGFEICGSCRGNVRYCGVVDGTMGLPNISVSRETQRLAWKTEMRRFADISQRCICDREGDAVFAAEYDRRPWSISYDSQSSTTAVKSNLNRLLGDWLSQAIEKLERLRKKFN
jgi:hypothetical protein